MCVYICVCMRACVRARAHVFVYDCVLLLASVVVCDSVDVIFTSCSVPCDDKAIVARDRTAQV